MLENFYKYKVNYKDYILMIRLGNFYEILDKDALILHNILNYKISKISDTVKCGFPISSLEKVLAVLNERKINYVIIEDDNIVSKKEFEENTYGEFNFDINTIKYNFIRINKIIKFLNENVNKDINSLLESIEDLINERR